MSEVFPLTVGFTEEVIGMMSIDQAKVKMLSDALASGQFTFSSTFRHNTVSDELTLINISLIPLASLSTVDYRLLNQSLSKKIFGVSSIFVDWNLNNIDKEIRKQVLRSRINDLQIEFVNKSHIEELTKYRKNLLIDSIISLAIVATGYGITEDDIQQALEPQKEIQ